MSAFDPFFKRRYCNPELGKIYFVSAQPFKMQASAARPDDKD